METNALNTVFEDLRRQDINACANAGFTPSESKYIVQGRKNDNDIGFCYFHSQCVREDSIRLIWGAYDETDESYELIRNIIKQSFKKSPWRVSQDDKDYIIVHVLTCNLCGNAIKDSISPDCIDCGSFICMQCSHVYLDDAAKICVKCLPQCPCQICWSRRHSTSLRKNK